jgi:hypothetical protein
VAEQSDSSVAARAELDQRQQGPEGDAEGALKQDAKQQEQAQSAQLAAGKAKGAARRAASADRKAARQGNEPGLGSADYGIYLQPGSLDENGYPLTAIVLLRDEHAAQVVVPYDALSATSRRGR